MCALSGRRRLCARTGSVHPGRSSILTEWLTMDYGAWGIQDSRICRHTSGILCSSFAKCSERESCLFFKSMNDASSDSLSEHATKPSDNNKQSKSSLLSCFHVEIFLLFLPLKLDLFLLSGCRRTSVIPGFLRVLRHQRCCHGCQVKFRR